VSNYRPEPACAPASDARFGVDPYADHIGARFLEFFADTSPWPRRLWDAGSTLTLRELYDASQWVDRSVLSAGALKWLAGDTERLLGRDPAVGPSTVRQHLQKALRSEIRPGTRHHRQLGELTDLVEFGYVERWSKALDGPRSPAPERLARAIAAHLLDRGYAMGFLHRWVLELMRRQASLGELLSDAAKWSKAQGKAYEVLVPFAAVPRSSEQASHLDTWRSSRDVASWLAAHGGAPEGVRQNGGFAFQVRALDPYAAATSATLIVERMVARSAYARSSGRRLEPLGRVWVGDSGVSVPLRPPHRGAFLLALEAEHRLYDVQGTTALDEALELASPLNFGAPGPAVSGSWAAIESLLVSPRDAQDAKEGRGAIAADRLAALVAASWPRAELTTLSHRHHPERADRLAYELAGVEVNKVRARIVHQALERGDSLVLKNPSDTAAASRMIGVINEPRETLGVVRGHVTAAIRRLYRQRNIMVHGGATESLARDVTLRTAAPLAAAGLDRIVHANLADGEAPLDVAERAIVRLGMVGRDGGPHIVDLLAPQRS
jgi:hypothetical protein